MCSVAEGPTGVVIRSLARQGRQQHCKTGDRNGHEPEHFGNPYSAKECAEVGCPNRAECGGNGSG